MLDVGRIIWDFILRIWDFPGEEIASSFLLAMTANFECRNYDL